MFNRLPIGSKLLVIFLIIGIVPAVLTGIATVWQSRDALSSLVYSQLESLREVKKAQIESYFAERQRDINVLLEMVSNLQDNAWQKLYSVQEAKIAQIQDYFQNLRNDLRILSRAEAVARAVEQFSEAMELDGGEAGMAWESLQGAWNNELQHIKTTLGYDDLLLIDHKGKIVYTAQQNSDFGLDLQATENENHILAETVNKVLSDQRLAFLDFNPYTPADKKQVMFALGPILLNEKMIGVLGFRINQDNLDEIISRRKGMGSSGESFLVGLDNGIALYRSSRQRNKQNLGEEARGEEVKKALTDEEGMMIKYDEQGNLRLSAYGPLQLEDLTWGLITSIDIEEILTPKKEDTQSDFFGDYLKEYQLEDLYLIHREGKIFYSVKHRADYNTNVLTGPYANTHLGQIVRRVLEKKTYQISDYGLYGPSGGEPVAFVAKPLLRADGTPELVVVVQLNDEALSSIMGQRTGLGHSGETYLVGNDYLLRSDSYLAPETYSVEASFAKPQQAEIRTRAVALALRGEEGRVSGANYLGQKVLSAYRPIQINQLTWALIADRSEQEAFMPIIWLEVIIGLITLVSILLVWTFSRGFTANLVSPLSQLNRQLKILAQGEPVEQEIIYQGRDEITELLNSARRLKENMDSTIAQANAVAKGDYNREVRPLSERDRLGRALFDMTIILRQVTASNAEQNWLKNGLAAINDKMRGTQDAVTLGKNVIDVLVKHLDAQVGLFYVYQEGKGSESGLLKLTASYAFTRRKGLTTEYPIGEGVVGQAALEGEAIIINELPEDYLAIQSGVGRSAPRSLVVVPMKYEDKLQGAVEIGSLYPFTDAQLNFLRQAAPVVAIGVFTAQSRSKLEELLVQSQAQAEELQSQSEELEVQQEELRQSNEELEERTQALERQKDQIRLKNEELQSAKSAMEQKAQELELASKYKSEFLANMSHELRTPLNSLLILAQMLANNKERTLSDKQVEYARTIHNAGTDLLNLINEILDLSKIEAGKIELQPEEFRLEDTITVMEQRFRHMAEDKGLQFVIDRASDLPLVICNDSQRLQQVLTNLLSNAFKFTSKGGSITLAMRRCQAQDDCPSVGLHTGKDLIISVTDTGIGIPADKQPQIFEAFQQADGSTSRKYGGTGLGLSITRQLVQLMGGAIRLHSVPEQGSTFSILIPERVAGHTHAASPFQAMAEATLHSSHHQATHSASSQTSSPPPSATHSVSHIAPQTIPEQPERLAPREEPTVEDDRNNLQPGDRVLLVIEDDPNFASLLIEIAREKQFKCLFAQDGAEGLELAKSYTPQAIVLDIGLPQVDGLTVVERLKNNPQTRHIPIHCVSGQEQNLDARKLGAIGYLLKPVAIEDLSNAFKTLERFINAKVKKLLLLTDSEQRKENIANWIDNDSIHITVAANREQAWQLLQQTEVDCLILDAGQHSDGRMALLKDIRKHDTIVNVPVILFAERELTREEEEIIQQSTEKVVIKSVQSPERLLDEATLFLHQVEANLPQEQRQILHRVHDQKEAILAGKRVLVVDDDVRNIYSLTAILEEKDMEVSPATDGKRALQLLSEEPGFHIVLMDIMMPEMDGYETMRRIRSDANIKKKPW